MSQRKDTIIRWSYVLLAFVECLVGTGVIFGFSGLQVALIRDGVYEELCLDDGGTGANVTSTLYGAVHAHVDHHCEAQRLRLATLFTAGAASFQVSMMAWGFLLDSQGSANVRVASVLLSAVGSLLMALGDSRTFDSFIPASLLLGCGGAGFLLSHFILAEHFKHGGNFGLVHAAINGAMDSATIVFFGVDFLQDRAGVTVRTSFLSLASLYVALALITPLWGKFLFPAADAVTQNGHGDEETDEDDHGVVGVVVGGGGGGGGGAGGMGSSSLIDDEERTDRAALYVSKLPFRRQLCTPHFAFLGCWTFATTTRVLFLLGTVEAHAEYGGGGRTGEEAKTLVGYFNLLLMVANVLTPLFGVLLDKCGVSAGLVLVNVLGVAVYALMFTPGVYGLSAAYVIFGCFRVWNFTSTSSYTQMVFGHESFGRVYGLGSNFFSLLSALLQYPLAAAALKAKSFAVIDLVLIAVVRKAN